MSLQKRQLFDALAIAGSALGSARRLEMLDLLAQGSRTVEELAQAVDQSVANTSQHLQILHAAGLLKRTREGTRVRYALAGDDVMALWVVLRDVAANRVAEVDRASREYLGEDVEAISRDELAERLRRREVVLVDVRPAAEYEAGHIEGAVSIPLDELNARLDELPAEAELVAYCRGPFCVYAHEAVRRLKAHDRRARRLRDGWPEWHLHTATPIRS